MAQNYLKTYIHRSVIKHKKAKKNFYSDHKYMHKNKQMAGI